MITRYVPIFDGLTGENGKNYNEVKVDGRNQHGSRVGEIKFEFLHKSSNIFSKLYFYVNSEARPSQPRVVLAQAPAGPSRQQEDSDNDGGYYPNAFLPYPLM